MLIPYHRNDITLHDSVTNTQCISSLEHALLATLILCNFLNTQITGSPRKWRVWYSL